MKKVISLVLIVCLLGTLFCACGGKKITAEEAYRIVLDDLKITADRASTPHIHESTFEGTPCFNIFITVENMELVYVVSQTGDILYKGTGSHSH